MEQIQIKMECNSTNHSCRLNEYNRICDGSRIAIVGQNKCAIRLVVYMYSICERIYIEANQNLNVITPKKSPFCS